MRGKLKQMQALFAGEADKHNVFPLNNDTFARATAPRPSATAGQTVFTYSGVMPGIATANSPSIIGRSYKITAEGDVPQGGGNGMLGTTGGRCGGLGPHLLNRKPAFDHHNLILPQYPWTRKHALT